MSADELYNHLMQNGVIGSEGITTFDLQDIKLKVKNVSVVGNIIQEWLGHYMKKHGIHYRVKENTQEFPDYLLDENNSDIHNLLEVKVFIKLPSFDVANFKAYARSLENHAYRLDAKYLIFEYGLVKRTEGAICIKNIWLKSVWEICCGSNRSPVKIQWKQDDPVNIRPAIWYNQRTKFKPFRDKVKFIEALYQVISMLKLENHIRRNWLDVVKKNYRDKTGNPLCSLE